MKRTLTAKMSLLGGPAALALGAAACDMDELDDPVDDGFMEEDLFEDEDL